MFLADANFIECFKWLFLEDEFVEKSSLYDSFHMYKANSFNNNKAFIDIRLRLGIATLLVVVG